VVDLWGRVDAAQLTPTCNIPFLDPARLDQATSTSIKHLEACRSLTGDVWPDNVCGMSWLMSKENLLMTRSMAAQWTYRVHIKLTSLQVLPKSRFSVYEDRPKVLLDCAESPLSGRLLTSKSCCSPLLGVSSSPSYLHRIVTNSGLSICKEKKKQFQGIN
jgi:hypothetical protein